MTVLSSPRVYQVVTSNRLRVWVGKKGERVASLLRKIARHFRTVNTDRNRTNAGFFEPGQTLLDAPQLGVARRSPVTSVKDQQHTLRRLAVDRRRAQLCQ